MRSATGGTACGADPRRWANVPGSASRYTIELIPANGATACSTANPDTSMIDAGSGTFKIRATGQDVTTQVKRSLVITMKRKSFLDYLYFTDKETVSPGLYGMYRDSRATRENVGAGRDVITWARQQCDRYAGDEPSVGNRAAQFFDGEYQNTTTGVWSNFDLRCKEAAFQPSDDIAGPMHSNDEIEIDCGSPAPKLGDSVDDAIETSGLGRIPTTPANPDAGWYGCNAPDVNFSTHPDAEPGPGDLEGARRAADAPADERGAQARHGGRNIASGGGRGSCCRARR